MEDTEIYGEVLLYSLHQFLVPASVPLEFNQILLDEPSPSEELKKYSYPIPPIHVA